MNERLRTLVRAIAGAALGMVCGTPLAAAHPGHSHDGLLGGAAHLIVDSGGLIVVVLLGLAVLSRRRRASR